MPRFDLPLGQALHGLGRFAVTHPATAVGTVLLPLCAAIVFMVYRDARRPVAGRWLRPGVARPLPSFSDDGLGSAHSG